MTQDELLTKPAGVLIKTTLVDFPSKVASAYFLRGCNLRCPYCYNVELVSPAAPSDSQDFVAPVQVLEHLYKRKNVIEGFVISGGEPLLHPATPILIKQAKALGYKIKLDTNGTLPLILQNLIDNPETRPDYIAMDIKTSISRYKRDIPVIENFRNADMLELITNSIRIIKSLGTENYEFRTVLIPGLTEEKDVADIASLLPEDSKWYFAQFRNENCLDPSYNEITPYTDKALNALVSKAQSLIPGAVLR